MTLRLRTASTAAAAPLAAALSACSGDNGGSEATAEDSHDHAETTVTHIHGRGINPAGGKLYVATHANRGLIKSTDSGKTFTKRLAGGQEAGR